jgi:hypothetical protein
MKKRTRAVPPFAHWPPRPGKSLNDASSTPRGSCLTPVTFARHGRLRLNASALTWVVSTTVWLCCTIAPRAK